MNLFTRTPEPILQPRDDIVWASGAVFNPGAWREDGRIHLLFRGIPKGYESQPLEQHDPTEPSAGFDNYVSYIGYASSTDGERFRWRKEPLLSPDTEADRYGAEDARISRIDDVYFITYTALSEPAFDGDGVRIGLATTTDFCQVTKHGVVGPSVRDKDAVIFPRLVGGRVAMLHRISPNIQLVYFDSVEQLLAPPPILWERHMKSLDDHVVMRPEHAWERKKIGAGPTPIETDEGWLLVYHGVDIDHVYSAGLALLDLDDPQKVIARTRQPVITPTTDFERFGDVDNVVFPQGAVVIDGTLHLYYGAADRVVGHATAPMSDLFAILAAPESRA